MFSGKIILLTGASSGIGAAAAIRFAIEGAKLALTGRNSENLEQTAQECETKSNLKPLTITGDLSNDTDVKNIIDTTIKTYGGLDVLINNAGVFFLENIEDAKIEVFDKIFATNVRAVYLLTSLAVPYLIKSKGCIVNVSSIAGQRPFPIFTAYCMSKSALDHFTKCLAVQLAPKQVRVNSVNPGIIKTPIHARAGMKPEEVQQLLGSCQRTHPLGRYGTVEETAEAIAFLASEKASFITGELLNIDGGCSLNAVV